jgi:predicted kinase
MKQLSFGEKLNQCITYTSSIDGFQVSFEKLCEYFPEFEKMKTVMQRPDWHQEGSVFNHTKLAVEYFLQQYKDGCLRFQMGYYVLIAILFHDMGKVFCPIGEDGYVKSGGHERLSEQYLKKMFFTTNDTFFSPHEMSLITTLVKHHDLRYKYKEMKPNTLNEAINEIKTVFRGLNWLKYFSHVWAADVNGSRPSPEKQDENIGTTIEFFKNRFCNPKPQMILMCGIPGSGKNYFIENNIGKVGFLESNPVIISRDDVRLELGIENGIGTDAQEKQVSKICDERLNEALKNRRNVIINNTNLKYKYRKQYYDLAKSNNYETVLYFIRRDFEKVLEARPGENWRNVINRMIENMDIPTNAEADFVREIYNAN